MGLTESVAPSFKVMTEQQVIIYLLNKFPVSNLGFLAWIKKIIKGNKLKRIWKEAVVT